MNKRYLIAIIIGVLVIAGIFAFTLINKNMTTKILIKTTAGDIQVELYPDKSPITVANFLKYVDAKSYEGVVFHRVMKDFMIQTGGFKEDGTQIKSFGEIKLESKNRLKNDRGTLAMARTSIPDSASSQFFINVADNDFLNYGFRDEGYAVFGKVISGMDVVDKIQSVQTTTKFRMSDWPVQDIKILEVTRI